MKPTLEKISPNAMLLQLHHFFIRIIIFVEITIHVPATTFMLHLILDKKMFMTFRRGLFSVAV